MLQEIADSQQIRCQSDHSWHPKRKLPVYGGIVPGTGHFMLRFGKEVFAEWWRREKKNSAARQ